MTDCSFVRSGLQSATLEFCSGAMGSFPTYIHPSLGYCRSPGISGGTVLHLNGMDLNLIHK